MKELDTCVNTFHFRSMTPCGEHIFKTEIDVALRFADVMDCSGNFGERPF